MHAKALAAALTGVAIFAASPASAQTFPIFKSICLDTQGRREAALATMDEAGGWTAVDTSKASLPPNVKLTDYTVRTHAVGGDVQSIVVGDGSTMTGSGPVHVEVCMMMGKLDPDAVANAKSWVGAAPTVTVAIPANGVNANMNIFMFKQGEDGGRTSIDLASATSGGALKAPVTMVITMEASGNNAMLARMNMKP